MRLLFGESNVGKEYSVSIEWVKLRGLCPVKGTAWEKSGQSQKGEDSKRGALTDNPSLLFGTLAFPYAF